jgi:hypothetical protein
MRLPLALKPQRYCSSAIDPARACNVRKFDRRQPQSTKGEPALTEIAKLVDLAINNRLS